MGCPSGGIPRREIFRSLLLSKTLSFSPEGSQKSKPCVLRPLPDVLRLNLFVFLESAGLHRNFVLATANTEQSGEVFEKCGWMDRKGRNKQGRNPHLCSHKMGRLISVSVAPHCGDLLNRAERLFAVKNKWYSPFRHLADNRFSCSSGCCWQRIY